MSSSVAGKVSLAGKHYREFFLLTGRQIQRSKCNYALGCWSCFLVVCLVALLDTALFRAPLAFMRLAELSNGELDVELTPGDSSGSWFLNYTTLSDRLSFDSSFSLHSPRYKTGTFVFPQAFCRLKANKLDPLDLKWKYSAVTERQSGCATYPTWLDRSCFSVLCPTYGKAQLIVLDSTREKDMGYGRTWDLPRLPNGSVYIQRGVASLLGIQNGDQVFLRLDLRLLIQSMFADMTPPKVVSKMSWGIVYIPVTVAAIFSSTEGKSSSESKDLVVMEWDTFEQFSKYIHPDLESVKPVMAQMSPKQYCNSVGVNMHDRLDIYSDGNYDTVQLSVIGFTSKMLYRLGYDQVMADMPILSDLSDSQLYTLYLSLLLSIIFALLVILSVLLIYSLLMISVETRTFELGVLRMVGLSRLGLFQLLFLHALMYALPAWALGLAAAQGAAIGAFYFFSKLILLRVNPALTPRSIIAATFLGFSIPALAAIFPIRAALTTNLQDALDTRHSKTQAVVYSIDRAHNVEVSWSLLTLGFLLALFGFLIYYLVPLSLVSFNLQLLLSIFFALLMGMIFGFVLLSLNFETFFERLVVTLLLWWESAPVRQIVRKNLVAHRMRNRKTTVMYGLSLGFIVFISVGTQLQTTTFSYGLMQKFGVHLRIRAGVYPNRIYAGDKIEAVLRGSAIVNGFAWVTHSLADIQASSALKIENIGHAFAASTTVYGVTPNLYNITIPGFLKVQSSSTSRLLSEALYSPRGSQSALVGTLYHNDYLFQLDGSFLLENPIYADEPFHRLRPLAFLDSSPAFKFSKFPSVVQQNLVVSLPTFLRLTRGTYDSVQSLPYRQVLIQLAANADDAAIDALITSINTAIAGQNEVDVWDYRDKIRPIGTASRLLNIILGGSTVLAMFLCVFSLASSMYASIYEQTKEMSVLRAMGCTRFMLLRVYIYEAFVLIFTASTVGVMIGVLIGYTITIQRAVFTQLPIPFIFPLSIVIVVLISAVICAFMASFWPAWSVLRKPIVQLMRMTT